MLDFIEKDFKTLITNIKYFLKRLSSKNEGKI